MPKQLVWLSHGAGRLMLGRESAVLQGFPICLAPNLESTREALLQDLSGNMMSPPVLLAFVMASLAALLWPTPSASTTATSSDVQAAVAAFNALSSCM